jgi:fused signal recognition particle receptor
MEIIVAVVVVLVLLGALVYFLVLAPKAGDKASPPEALPPAKAETPKPRDKPKAETPKAETPKAETPKAETPKAETPKAETPEAETPEAETPEAETPDAETPEAETPEAETPEAETPDAEPPRAAEPERLPAAEPATRPKAEAPESVQAYKKGLATTRGGFIARLAQLFGRKKEIDPALLDEVQTVLLTADIGPRTAEKMVEGLRDKGAASEEAVWESLRQRAREVLGPSAGAIRLGRKPTVILVVGVNGVGKTTTIGKLASRFQEDGKKVVLAAGDTFRAAAVLQLEVWGKRVGCEVVKGKDRADPGAVVFDAIKKGLADGADVVIADTAGRLHTKSNLMEELKKVVRTAEKALERPVDEILLVLDATTGQNAVQQAQLFREAIPVNGIVLTKLDGTAKGGVVLAIANEHGIPVRYVGIGERVEDLRPFDVDTFVTALFEQPDEGS